MRYRIVDVYATPKALNDARGAGIALPAPRWSADGESAIVTYPDDWPAGMTDAELWEYLDEHAEQWLPLSALWE